MDKIKNALTKNKKPLQKYKNPPTCFAFNKYKNLPKKYINPPKKYKIDHITKKTPKMTIRPLFSFLRSF
jgi:hypothetical protein